MRLQHGARDFKSALPGITDAGTATSKLMRARMAFCDSVPGAIRQQSSRGERSPQAGRFGRREYAIERGPFRPGSGRQAPAERPRNCDSAERVLPVVETWLRTFLLRAQQNGNYPCSHIAVRLPQRLLPAQKRGKHYAERTIRAAIAAISRHCFAIAPSPYSSAISARRSNIFGASRP